MKKHVAGLEREVENLILSLPRPVLYPKIRLAGEYNVRRKLSRPMPETWKCKCGEDVSDTYAECWNCQSPRPGYSSYAEQVEQYDRQTRRTDQMHDEMERQNRRVDQMQDEMERQNRRADDLLDRSLANEGRFAALLTRFELIADKIEARFAAEQPK